MKIEEALRIVKSIQPRGRKREGIFIRPRVVSFKNDDFIVRDGAVVGHFVYGGARIARTRCAVFYPKTDLQECVDCGVRGHQNLSHRANVSVKWCSDTIYSWMREIRCNRCFFRRARVAIRAFRAEKIEIALYEKENQIITEMSDLVKEFRIVLRKPIRDWPAYADRFNERVRPTSIGVSTGRNKEAKYG